MDPRTGLLRHLLPTTAILQRLVNGSVEIARQKTTETWVGSCSGGEKAYLEEPIAEET